MRISVGNMLTIRGRHFKAKAKRNTVIFRVEQRPHRVREAAPRQRHQAGRARAAPRWRAC